MVAMLPETAGEKQNRITCAVDKMVFMCVTALKISVSASDSSLSLHVINIVILRDTSTCISDSCEMTLIHTCEPSAFLAQ